MTEVINSFVYFVKIKFSGLSNLSKVFAGQLLPSQLSAQILRQLFIGVRAKCWCKSQSFKFIFRSSKILFNFLRRGTYQNPAIKFTDRHGFIEFLTWNHSRLILAQYITNTANYSIFSLNLYQFTRRRRDA